MKIGLLTYHAVSNFGANLQALSTVRCLQKRGIDVKVINWQPSGLSRYYEKSVSSGQRRVHEDFAYQNLPLTRMCVSNEEVDSLLKEEEFDAIIVGSDAVFSYIPILSRIRLSRRTVLQYRGVTEDHDFPNPFWGCFIGNTSCKLFALSASAQYLDIYKCLWFETRRLRKSLEKFQLIYVRDSWTKRVVDGLIDKEAMISPDPVFAFNDNVGELYTKKDIKAKYGLNERYVILSFCSKHYDEKWYNELYGQLVNLGLQVVNLAMPEGIVEIKSDIVIGVPLDPIEWYYIIKYSDGYIGQRMHPMIVALSNKVPFVLFDHYAYKNGRYENISSKVWDILNRADLLNQYVSMRRDIVAPSDCVSRLNTFNRNTAEEFVSAYSARFHLTIDKILSVI